MKRQYYHLLLFALSLLFWNCAQVAPLTGGAKDTRPPKLTQATPANASTEFSGTSITLTFDEYIQIKDLQNQLIITPSLKADPEIIAEGKKIKINLQPEELLPNTTYRIFFGRAIVDMTEGNAYDGFQYVFSTGKSIDTLKLSGTVTSAVTNNAVKDALVVLYPANAKDSVVFDQQPLYISKTNAAGTFALDYLPENSFKIFALLDKNKNYRYDGEEEEIAFLESPVYSGDDSSLRLTMFSDAGGKLFIKKKLSPQNGLLHVIYNRKSHFDVTSLLKDVKFVEKEPGREKDTVSIYYFSSEADSVIFKIRDVSGLTTDTVGVMIPKINPNRKKTLNLSPNVVNGVLSFNRPLQLAFSSMPDSEKTDETKIRLYQKTDSALILIPHEIKFVVPASAKIKALLKAGSTYLLKIDTAAFFDFNGRYNDSTTLVFKTQTKEELGKLILNLKVSKKQAYVIQLINEQEKVVKEYYKFYALNSSASETIDFTDVLPGTYKIRVVFDDNENKKWDSGRLMKKIQPERIFIHPKQIKVLLDWELEEEVKVF